MIQIHLIRSHISLCMLSFHSYGYFKCVQNLYISWYRIDVLCMLVGKVKKSRDNRSPLPAQNRILCGKCIECSKHKTELIHVTK